MGGFLSGVTFVSARSAWAVGAALRADVLRPLIVRWRGGAWQRVADLRPAGIGVLRGVDAVSASNAWAVGSANVTGKLTTLILHWNGTAWK
jgi:hypothetical protein